MTGGASDDDQGGGQYPLVCVRESASEKALKALRNRRESDERLDGLNTKANSYTAIQMVIFSRNSQEPSNMINPAITPAPPPTLRLPVTVVKAIFLAPPSLLAIHFPLLSFVPVWSLCLPPPASRLPPARLPEVCILPAFVGHPSPQNV